MIDQLTDRPRPVPAMALPDSQRPDRLALELADGYVTSVYVHRPVGSSSGPPVMLLHGIQSHPGWFYGSARALADAGQTVYQVTRRGSGDNCLARGHAQSLLQLLDDVERAGEFILADSGADTLRGVGVSWGGKLLTAWAAMRRNRGPLDSLTLVAPGLAAKVGVSAATKLGIAACLLVAPQRHFEIPLSRPELFTDNPAMIDYLRGDRFRLKQATARFLYLSRQFDRRLKRTPGGAIDVPTRLMLSANDRIIDNDATTAILQRLCGQSLSVQTLHGAHTLEFEPDPTAYRQAVVAACGASR